MYALEFETTVHNGTISVPEQYKSKLGSRCKVIILQDDIPDTIPTEIKNRFLTKVSEQRNNLPANYKFSREELNER
ncbi:MAG: hypothetical protein D6B27_02770 [Gammaproteobacteria bacterium]|nr:MAG: hypothetical protein D6B27_02770 [Gammaproteobacteria bacterium]